AVFGKPHRLHGPRYLEAARSCPVSIFVEQSENDEGAVDGFPCSPLLRRPGRSRDSGPDPPDPAREEDGPAVSVADVRAADPVPDRPPPEDSRPGAALRAAGGAAADH